MTDDEIKSIRERLAAAQADGTQPWTPYKSLNGWHLVLTAKRDPLYPEALYTESDVRLIANAPTDIAALLDEVERLRGDLRFAAEWASASLGERHWEVEDNARLAAIFRDLGSEPT